MNRTAFVATTLALSLALGGCSSSLSTTRDKPIDDDRETRTIGNKIDDSLIETKTAANIAKADPALDKNSHIIVVSYSGIVLITGQTPRADLRNRAEQAAHTVQKIKNMRSELQVTSPSSLLARNNDTWITTKLKTQMLSDPNAPSSRIKVVTENDIAYMTSLVNQREAAQAVHVAQGVDGVRKIVKLFEYID